MLAAVDSESPALESAETPIRTSVFRIFEQSKDRKASLGGAGAFDAVAKDQPVDTGQPAASSTEASASGNPIAKKLASVAQKGGKMDDVPEETMPNGESEDVIGGEGVADDGEDEAADEVTGDQSHMPFVQVEVSWWQRCRSSLLCLTPTHKDDALSNPRFRLLDSFRVCRVSLASQSQPMVRQEAGHPLPPGWQKLRIADDAPEHGGHVYYLNETTMETRWTPPEMDDDTVDAWTAKRSPENAKRGHLAFGSSKPPPRKLIFRHKLADVDLQLDVPPGIKAKLLSEEEGQEHAGNDTDAELQQDGTSAEAEPLLLIVSVTKNGQLHEVGVRAGDRIVAVAGINVASIEAFREALDAARSRGEAAVSVRIKRDNTWATARVLGGSAWSERLHSAVTLSTQRSQYRGRLRQRMDMMGGANSSGGRNVQDRKKKRGQQTGGSGGGSGGRGMAAGMLGGQAEWNGKFYLENSIASNPFELKSSQTFEAKVDPNLSSRVPILTVEGESVAFSDGVPTGKTLRPGQRFHFKSMKCVAHAHEDGKEYGVAMYELVWGESCWVHDFNVLDPTERTIKSDRIVFSVPSEEVVERPKLRSQRRSKSPVGRKGRERTDSRFEVDNPLVTTESEGGEGGEEAEGEAAANAKETTTGTPESPAAAAAVAVVATAAATTAAEAITAATAAVDLSAEEGGETQVKDQNDGEAQDEEDFGDDEDEDDDDDEEEDEEDEDSGNGDQWSNLVGFSGELIVHAPLGVNHGEVLQGGAALGGPIHDSADDAGAAAHSGDAARPSTAPGRLSLGGGRAQQAQLSVVECEPGGQFGLAGGKRGDRIVAVNGHIVATGDQLLEALEASRLLGEPTISVEVKRTKKWDRTSTERLYEDHKVRTRRLAQLAKKHHAPPSFMPELDATKAHRVDSADEPRGNSSDSGKSGGHGVFHRLWSHAKASKEKSKEKAASWQNELAGLSLKQRSNRLGEDPAVAKKRKARIMRKTKVGILFRLNVVGNESLLSLSLSSSSLLSNRPLTTVVVATYRCGFSTP